jgi:hypothetical protein
MHMFIYDLINDCNGILDYVELNYWLNERTNYYSMIMKPFRKANFRRDDREGTTLMYLEVRIYSHIFTQP